jgi:hypothetical protein
VDPTAISLPLKKCNSGTVLQVREFCVILFFLNIFWGLYAYPYNLFISKNGLVYDWCWLTQLLVLIDCSVYSAYAGYPFFSSIVQLKVQFLGTKSKSR